MVIAELVGGPLDGETRAIPKPWGRIEFAVLVELPSLDEVGPADVVKPVKTRKVYYKHAGGNRYVWQDMAPAFR